jgi:acyl carrier protein
MGVASLFTKTARTAPTARDIETWIATKLEDALDLEPGEIAVDEPFDRYGLDSSAAVDLISALEDWLGRELPANLVYEYPTIAALAGHLGAEATR